MHTVAHIIGLIGTFIILFWYFLLQSGRCKNNDLHYSLANAIGSVFLLCSLWYEWNLALVIIEIAWFFISLYGAYKTLRGQN